MRRHIFASRPEQLLIRRLYSSKKSEQESPVAPPSTMLLEPAKLIGWLGASVAGLTIFLLSVGFLALSAHDAMLGIPRTIEDKSEYVVIGSLFFSRSVMFLLSSLLDNAQSWGLLGALLIIVGLFHWTKRMRVGKHLVSVALICFIVVEIFALWLLTAPLQFEDVLVQTVTSNDPEMLRWIVCNRLDLLQSEYGFLVLLVLSLVLILKRLEHSFQVGPKQETRDKNVVLWRYVRIPALALMVICIFLLPRAYGVLTLSNSYPVINLFSKDGPAWGEQVFLLRSDDKILVTYDGSQHKLSTRKRDSFERYDIIGNRHTLNCPR